MTERRKQTKTWTKEVKWSEVARVAKLLHRVGLIDRLPESRIRRALKTSPNAQKRKVGKADSAAAFFRSRRKPK